MDLLIFITLILIGLFAGRAAEKRHYRSIIRREKELADIPIFSARFPPPRTDAPDSKLVGGSVVVSVDYFKRFVAGLRMIIGGRIHSYESLLDRARREAILRMKQQAKEIGADSVFNVRLETSSISKGYRNSIGSVEVYAYGTALISGAVKRV